jgi:hypothetical protein
MTGKYNAVSLYPAPQGAGCPVTRTYAVRPYRIYHAIEPKALQPYDLGTMREVSSFRRAAAFFCLAVVLLAALTPSATSLPVAILVTLSFLIAIAIFVFLPHVEEQNHPQQTLALPDFSPRPPPAR